MPSLASTILMLSSICASAAAGPGLVEPPVVSPAVAQIPSVQELLGRYAGTMEATQSFIDSYDASGEFGFNRPGMASPMLDGKRFERGQHRADGRRTYIQTYSWGDINPRLRNLPESSPRYHVRIEAARRLYDHSMAVNDPRVKGSATWQPLPTAKSVLSVYPYSGVFGFLGAEERLDAVLRLADHISVRRATESVNGSNCFVIEARTEYGEYTVWLDPQHGWQPAKVTRKVTGGQRDHDRIMPKGDCLTTCLDRVRFEQVDGTWVPVEADQTEVYVFENPEFFSRQHCHFKRTRIVLRPDHDKLGSFADPLANPAQDPELRNGTKVQVWSGDPRSVPPQYSWQDGRVVDSAGKAVDMALARLP